MHVNGHESSVLATVMDHCIENQDSDVNLNPCEVEAQCCLATGIEACFVSLTSHFVVTRLCKDNYNIAYNQAVYIPNIRAEQAAGFDLSIGNAFNRPRIRTMHKHLYGSNQFNCWCDEEWEWSIRKETEGDHRHLHSLLMNYEKENKIFSPFLVLHICYCLHEYRRMGMNINNIEIPDFDHPLRTIVINLQSVVDNQDEFDWHEILDSNDFRFLIHKSLLPKNDNQSDNDYLQQLGEMNLYSARITGAGNEIDLSTMTLSNFIDHHIKPLFNI